MKEKKLHMIGHAHLDPVWLWQWQEGFQEVKATFRSALDRMKEYDDFMFINSSAAFYEWVEKNDPAMFTEIKERVVEGRWEFVGGWWVEPDCNIPGGESFVRQGLYGQRYFKEKFGVTAKVGFNADSFGHNGMLPQLLKKSGMDYYIFMRPMPNEKGLPNRLFWWESDDGSRVLTYRIPFEYLTWGKDVEKHVQRVTKEIKAPFNELMCFYGVGNHGGGPTKGNLESIQELNKSTELPELKFNNPGNYFEEISEKDLPFPVVHDDLQHHASGCYAAHSGIKMWNREAENSLIKAEKFSILANWLTGQPYPEDYTKGWKNVLFNQFHDILAGTSLKEAYDDARNMHGEAMTIASRGMNYAIQSLSWKIEIEEIEGMKPIVVFNPHSWDSKVSVELEIGKSKDEITLVDEQGVEIALQSVQSHATANGRDRIGFIAALPSMGYRLYKLLKKRPEEKHDIIRATDYSMENERYRIEIDNETGFIARLYDKEKNFEVFEKCAARPVVIEDKSDTWSHNVFKFDKEIGEFKANSIRLVEHGPVKSVIRVRSSYDNSEIVQDFTMYSELDNIDVKVTIDWREQFKMLKLKFPVNLNFRKATYEIPYGHIEREVNGEEEPGQSWIDLSGIMLGENEIYGVSLLNDAKYSYDIMNKEISLTVLRSPIYAHHDPKEPNPDDHYTYIDQGIQEFNYSILAHEGSWESAGTVKKALELNQPPVALIETYHQGELPQKDSLLQVSKDNIIVSVMKKAEDNDDMIIRCYETDKVETEVQIDLPKWGRKIKTTFRPCEIKTLRIPQDQNQNVVETDFLEW